MRFLADENVMGQIVVGLRAFGFDVLTVAEHMQGAADPEILHSSAIVGRILITEDKDFGELVIRDGISMEGVVLLQLGRMVPKAAAQRAVAAITDARVKLIGAFTVVEPNRIRSRSL